jgi:HK97 family phage major capsid protein
MDSIQAVRERRNEQMRALRNLMDNNPGSKWNADCQAKYDAGVAEVERAESEIARIERVLALEADKPAGQQHPEAREAIERARAGSRKMSAAVAAAFDKWSRHGERSLDASDWQQIRNTMSTTTTTEGGYTVQTEIASTVIDALKDYSGVMDVAEILRTANGAALNFPSSDGTAETGEQIAENITATGADPVFGSVPLNVYKFSSKVVAVPFELLQDSQVDIEAFIMKRLRQRLGRILNTRFTTGSGAGQPNGLVTASSAGKVGVVGQTLTIIYDDLVDLIDSVDIAYQSGKVGFMFAQSMRKVIRKLKDTSGRPIWMPSYEAGIAGKMAETLMGFDVKINNDMAAPGANNKTVLFGDLSQYKVRVAMEMQMFRFSDSAYTKLGQIGFLAWMRAGGNLVDAAAVKYYQHSAT